MFIRECYNNRVMFQADSLGCLVLKESCDFNLLSTYSQEIIKDVFPGAGQVREGAAPGQGAEHLQEGDPPDPEVNQDQKEKVMAAAVRTIASHLRVTGCMGLPASTGVPRASH